MANSQSTHEMGSPEKEKEKREKKRKKKDDRGPSTLMALFHYYFLSGCQSLDQDCWLMRPSRFEWVIKVRAENRTPLQFLASEISIRRLSAALLGENTGS